MWRFVEQRRKFVQETLQRAEDSVEFFMEITTLTEIEDELVKCSVFKHSETCCLRQDRDEIMRDCTGNCACG